MRTPFLAITVVVLCASLPLSAGGPSLVAGSGFDSEVKGRPLTWANGNVQYFTDQGNLSPILNNSQADAIVAAAFATWTSIPGVALSPIQAGHLAEDVSGGNVVGYPDGTYTIPNDVQPSAVATPVGIVYDYDGQVTEALLGYGAGTLDLCFTNAVYGGADNFTDDAHLAHALVVINGICAADASRVQDVRYRLVRTLGRVLGLGWSQANLNVNIGNPIPGPDDLAGFPLMHLFDGVDCVPITVCYPEPDVPKMDDRAALRRLYPADGTHRPATARIHGSVYFTDALGNRVQPMQGVNVVARRIDVPGKPSRRYVATSVSGFAFRGNAGNMIDGFVDVTGERYDRFGSDDPALEGAFDLAGLELADGAGNAQFEVSVEALDATLSERVGPYSPYQVEPSGWLSPVIVTVQPGSDVTQDLLMQSCQTARRHLGSDGSYSDPATLPLGGGWGAWISGYGDTDWFQFPAQANRTASVSATALDGYGQPTQAKLMPVIGIWPLSDQSGGPAPAATSVAFNTLNPGMTRLDAQFNSPGAFRIGISDFRGDGRPDYFYVASVLYSDSVTPPRLSLAGGVATLNGIGFHPGLKVKVAGNDAPVLAAFANSLEVLMPQGLQDGNATITVNDPASGGFSQMIDALNYGAASTDQLLLLQGAEPATPVGSPAANPIRVRAVAADGVTPVSGATLAWTASNATMLSACNGAFTCSVLTDDAGIAATWATPTTAGQGTITASLAPGSYTPPKTKQATLLATSSALDIGAVVPTRWIARGATLDVPLSVRVLSQGHAQAGTVVNFHVTNGAATLSSASGTTDGSGYATVSAHLANHTSDLQVSACVGANNTPCQTFTLFATPASLWTLETVSGGAQLATAEYPFHPLTVRVTDGSANSNPVAGARVLFATTLARVYSNPVGPGEGGGGAGGGTGMPVLLGQSQAQVLTDDTGLATVLPSAASFAPCDVFIAASTGGASLQFHLSALTTMGGGAARIRQVAHHATGLTWAGFSHRAPSPLTPQYAWWELPALPVETILREDTSSETAAPETIPHTVSSAPRDTSAEATHNEDPRPEPRNNKCATAGENASGKAPTPATVGDSGAKRSICQITVTETTEESGDLRKQSENPADKPLTDKPSQAESAAQRK